MSGRSIAARLARAPTPFDLAQEVAQRRSTHSALEFLRSPRDQPLVMTYCTLAENVRRAAAALRDLGVAEGDGIAIILPAMPEGVAALLAATTVGVAFPLNPLLSAQAMATQLNLARARVAIVANHPSLDVAARLKQAAKQVASLHTIVELSIGDDLALEQSWSRFLGGASPQHSFVGAPDRTAALFHTGGTTGQPKLAELSARNIAAAALMATAIDWSPDDRILSGLPLFHVGGAVSVTLCTLSLGATVIFPGVLGARDPDLLRNIWKVVSSTHTTILATVPTWLAGLADIPVDGADLTALRAVCTGAAALPGELRARLESKLERPLSEVYGMTETSGFCSAQPCDGRFRGSGVGYPAPDLRIELRDSQGHRAARGELYLSGPNIFQGYRTASGRSGAPLDGWIASGDLGSFADDGQLRLHGRSKDVIIRGGHNIDPLMIEDVAQLHPAVRLSCAVAMPDEYAGELPVLYVALRAGTASSPEDISNFLAERIAERPARPKRVFIVADLPLTPAGKVARYKLRQAAAVQRLREAIDDPLVEAIQCNDTAAKTITIVWRGQPSMDACKRIDTLAGRLGLTVG